MSTNPGVITRLTTIEPVASSPDGVLAVRTTEGGLPLAIHIDPIRGKKYADAPAQLARELLHLCHLAGRRGAAARRQEFLDAGVPESFVEQMGLGAGNLEIDDADDDHVFSTHSEEWTHQ